MVRFLLALLLVTPAALAQGDPDTDWSDRFYLPTIEPNFSGMAISHVAVGPDGSTYVAGLFTALDGTPAEGIARWDGTQWHALGALVLDGGDSFGEIYDLAVTPDGSVWVCGVWVEIRQPDGSVTDFYGFARWDGTRWHDGLLPAWTPSALAVGPDGALYAASFAPAAPRAPSASTSDRSMMNESWVYRWDGATWTPIAGGLRHSQFNVWINALAIEADGTFYVGGYFDEAENPGGDVVTVRHVARWNGTAWEALGGGITAPTTPAWTSVNGLTLGEDGALYVGGRFQVVEQPDGTPLAVPNAARWTGTAWEPLGGGLGDPGASSLHVSAVTRSSEGGIYFGGYFHKANLALGGGDFLATRNVARWTGTGWAALGDGGSIDTNGVEVEVEDLAAAPDGSVLVVGWMNRVFQANGRVLPTAHRARWTSSGWATVSVSADPQGLNAWARALVAGTDGTVAVGSFSVAGTAAAPRVAMWDGSRWYAPGGEFRNLNGVGASVVTALRLPDGRLVVGGRFEEVVQPDGATLPVRNVAAWDGARWHPVGGGTDEAVRALAVSAEGHLCLGGSFTTAYGADGTPHPARRVACWTGSAWRLLGDADGNGVDGTVHTLVVHDGHLVLGGAFATAEAGGTTTLTRRIARWTGAGWAPFAGGLGGPDETDAVVQALLVDGEGRLFAGGRFASAVNAALVAVHGIARWDEGAWRSVGGGVRDGNDRGHVFALTEGEPGVLFGGGRFTEAGEGDDTQAANSIAAWNGAAWVPLGSGIARANNPETEVDALAFADGTLHVGGRFTEAGGKPAFYFSQWSGQVSVGTEQNAPETAQALTLAASPNPFTRAATLTFGLPSGGHARLVVYDALGRKVAVLADGPHAAGRHEAHLGAGGLPSGIYLVRLEADGRTATRMVTVLR